MPELLLVLGWLLSAALATLFGGAFAAFAAWARVLEERERGEEPAELTGFMLRDTTTIIAAWALGGFLLGLGSVVLLVAWVRSLGLLPPGWGDLAAVFVDTLVLLAGLGLWKRPAEATPRAYCRVAAVLGLPFYLLVYPARRPVHAALEKLYPPPTLRAGMMFRDDVRDMAENGEHGGLLDRDEREMIQRVFLLGETTVREIMVPRIDMVALEISAPVSEVIALVREKRHSRFPVYRVHIDNIVGFLHIKDLVVHLDQLDKLDLGSLIRPAHFVPETKRADDLLSEMRARRMHLAIAVDEYGGTAGLVTLEDVIEEVVGEIQDESDKEQPLLRRLQDGSFQVSAKIDLDDLNQQLDLQLPTEDFDTLGGFVYGLAGKIPAVGDRFRHGDLEFVVAGVRGRRITQVIVRPPREASPTPSPEP